jgi:hypothetical protein
MISTLPSVAFALLERRPLRERSLRLRLPHAVAASFRFTGKTRLREFCLNRGNGFVRVCELVERNF